LLATVIATALGSVMIVPSMVSPDMAGRMEFPPLLGVGITTTTPHSDVLKTGRVHHPYQTREGEAEALHPQPPPTPRSRNLSVVAVVDQTSLLFQGGVVLHTDATARLGAYARRPRIIIIVATPENATPAGLIVVGHGRDLTFIETVGEADHPSLQAMTMKEKHQELILV
jgi:hypothetical protein